LLWELYKLGRRIFLLGYLMVERVDWLEATFRGSSDGGGDEMLKLCYTSNKIILFV